MKRTFMKRIIVISVTAVVALSLSGCVMRETTTNSRGVVTDDKYIIKRPVKDFIEKVEFE
jgi:hypothetical protein